MNVIIVVALINIPLYVHFGDTMHVIKCILVNTSRSDATVLESIVSMSAFVRSLRLMVMPMLSPTMKDGTIKKLSLKPTQQLSSHDVVFELNTHTLLNTSEESTVMDIEIIEDMYVAKVIAQDGATIKVGQAIALLCDNLEDIAKAQETKIPENYNAYDVHLAKLPSGDTIPIAMWQAYAKVEVIGCK